MSEHEPCPFCGRADHLSVTGDEEWMINFVACAFCSAQGPYVVWHTEDCGALPPSKLTAEQAALIKAECWRRWDKRVEGVLCTKK